MSLQHEKNILATNLRKLREGRYISIERLAKATGVSKTTICAIENGQSNTRMDIMERLASFFDITISDLMYEPPRSKKIRHLRDTLRQLDAASEQLRVSHAYISNLLEDEDMK